MRRFLKQERCGQPHVRAEALDQLVWEEVSSRLQDPALILEAYREHRTQRRQATAEHPATEQHERLKAQIKFAHKELSRLLDAYQSGVIELSELTNVKKALQFSN